MVKFLKYLVLSLFVTVPATGSLFAQGQYGNEWINYNQTYHKIKVTATGLHRLDYAYIQSFGLADINPKQLLLFRRGREIAFFASISLVTSITKASLVAPATKLLT